MRFRKRPVEIEAVQLSWPNWEEVCALIGPFPEGMRGVYVGGTDNTWGFTNHWGPPLNGNRIGLLIPTLEGEMLAVEGDWIIKGIEGEFYPCKPGIFEKTYEPVEST